jgi:hypothetical protein
MQQGPWVRRRPVLKVSKIRRIVEPPPQEQTAPTARCVAGIMSCAVGQFNEEGIPFTYLFCIVANY